MHRHRNDGFSQGSLLQGQNFEDSVFPSSFLIKHQHTGRHEACFLRMLLEVTLWPVHAVANLVWVLLVLPLGSLVVSGPVPLAMTHEFN